MIVALTLTTCTENDCITGTTTSGNDDQQTLTFHPTETNPFTPTKFSDAIPFI